MEAQVEFRGRKMERELAQTIFHLMMQQGAMYALDKPIRQSLGNLTEYFFEQGLRRDPERIKVLIETALQKNDHIFAREERQDTVFYVTSKRGHPLETEEEPALPPRQLHEPPKGATAKPRRRAVRRPPMAPFWVRTSIRQIQARPTAPTTPTHTITAPTVEEVAVAAVARDTSRVTKLTLEDEAIIDFEKELTEIFAQHAPVIGEKLYEALDRDFRLLSFGDLWYLEDQVERFSKGRLNEIRRYILEEEMPLSDETILGDLFFKSPRDEDYNLWAFSLNARLVREKKDFEYVGVPGSNRWSVKGLPAIGSSQTKASDLGQDYDYLLEEEPMTEELPAQLEHFLTFYEYRYGVLPYNPQVQAFFPPAFLEDQRTAQLRFEMPQHYEAYTVELRYPSGNRGGWLWGLEEFFHSSLVPGAFIIISRTEEPDVFVLQYLVTDAQENSLLVYDDRKKRYTYDDILYYCETDASMLLNEERLPGLRNSKQLPPSKRKRPAEVVAHAFTLVGEKQDGQYLIALEDLFAVVNIQRPFSLKSLQRTLEEVDVFAPAEVEGFYVYTPDDQEK